MIPVTDYIKRNVYVRKVQSSLASQKFLQAFKDLNLDESNLCLFHVLIKYPQWEKDVDLFQFIRKKNVKQLRKDPKTFFLFDASTEGFSTIYGNTPFYDVLYHNCRVHNISPKKVILITSNMVENKNLIRYNTYHSIKESIHVASFHNFEHMLFNLKVDTLPVSGLAEAELDTRIEKVYLNAVKNRKRYYYGEKHFLSLSRVNRPHRTLSAFEIFNSNLYQNCILSHDRIKKPEHYCQETELIRGSKGKLSFRALKKFNRHLPLIADTNDFKTNHAMSLSSHRHWSTLFQVIGETLAEDWDNTSRFWSEKTFRSIFHMQPFLIWGQPNANKNLEDYGYKLYDKMFDYSFDSESNTYKRWTMIKGEIESAVARLNKMTGEDKLLWCFQQQDVLKHNYKIMYREEYTKEVFQKLAFTLVQQSKDNVE